MLAPPFTETYTCFSCSIPSILHTLFADLQIYAHTMLDVTVVRCIDLKDTEFISRQDPYVCIRYGGETAKTRTCTDGGRNPTFQEKFVFTDLVEGRRELNVDVWNSNTFTLDDHIGSGRIPLLKVLREGFDDSSWPLQCKRGRHAGEIKLILRYQSLNKHPQHQATHVPSHAPPPTAPPQSQSPYLPAYGQPPPSPFHPAAFCPYNHAPPPVYYPPPVPMSTYPPPRPYAPQPAVYYPPQYPPPHPGQYSGSYPPY